MASVDEIAKRQVEEVLHNLMVVTDLTEAELDIIRAMIAGEARSFGFHENTTCVDPEGVEWEQVDLWIRQPRLTPTAETPEKTTDTDEDGQVCPKCHGTGEVEVWPTWAHKAPSGLAEPEMRECDRCNGTGRGNDGTVF